MVKICRSETCPSAKACVVILRALQIPNLTDCLLLRMYMNHSDTSWQLFHQQSCELISLILYLKINFTL